MSSTAKSKTDKTKGYAATVEKPDGGVEVLLPGDRRFGRAVAAVVSDFEIGWNGWSVPGRAYTATSNRMSQYQRLVQGGRLGLRDILVPAETDYDSIIDRINWYANANSLVTRALSIRAALNAAEFNIFVPKNEDELVWLQGLCRELKMYSAVREMFWNLRAFDQVVVLWKTSNTSGFKPVSIECQDPRIVRPEGPGHTPTLFMYPAKDKVLSALAGMGKKAVDNPKLAAMYPVPMIEAAKKMQKIDVKDLEEYGYHYEYVARNRRDWDDTAFPSMYSIFADLEILNLAAEIDANALHHYKVGILQFAIGPENPTDPKMITGQNALAKTEAEVRKQLQNRLASLFTRGDLRINWIVPPVEMLSEAKYKASQRRVFNWLGLPLVAWAGEDLQGAYAAAVSAMKFLRAESEDDRMLMKEMLEDWLTGRAKSSNRFSGAQPVRVRFDPNALVEDRIILDMMKLFMLYGGASEQTILDMADLDPEFEAYQRKMLKGIKQDYKIDFAPEFIASKGAASGEEGGRPNQGERPRSEEMTGPQSRPSRARIEAIAEALGKSVEYVEDAIRDAQR